MKKLLPLFSCLILIGCAEKKESGVGAADNDEGASESTTSGEAADASASPESQLVVASAKVQRLQAKQTVRELQQAILAYQLEYGRLPCEGEEDIKLNTEDDDIMSILAGDGDKLNIREIPFYQGERAKDAKGQMPVDGIYGEEGHLKLADPWGQPYVIIMDANYDGKMQNPKSDDGGKEMLRGAVIVWSTGKPRKTGVPNDPKDWLTSW